MVTNVAMRRARVSGRFASLTRYRIAYRLALLSFPKNARASSFAASAAARSGGTVLDRWPS